MKDKEMFIEEYGEFKMRKLTEDDLEQFNGFYAMHFK